MIIDYPKDLRYTQHHIWVRPEGKQRLAQIGLTEELAHKLQEILGIDMPMVGDELEMDAPCIHIHRATSISYLPGPLSGRVTQVNKDVLDRPRLIALGPYVHWLFCMEYDEEEEMDMLMTAAQYAAFLDSL